MRRKGIMALLLGVLFCLTCFGCGTTDNTDPKDDATDGNQTTETITFADSKHEDKVNFYGRCYLDAEKGVSISNSSAGFEVKFYGTSLKASILATESKEVGGKAPELAGNGYLYIFVDDVEYWSDATVLELTGTSGTPEEVVLAENLPLGEHTLKALKVTEAKYTQAYVKSVTTDGNFRTPPAKPTLKMEIIGDSIMSGANAMRFSDNDEKGTDSECSLTAYGAIAASYLGAQFNSVNRSGLTVSGGNPGKNFAKIGDYYGLYGEYDPVAWDFSSYVPDVVVLDLGYNDLGNGTSETLFTEAYTAFVAEIRSHYADAYIFCCAGAMKGVGNPARLDALTSAIVEEFNDAGDDKILYVKLVENTSEGHPKSSEHIVNGSLLAGRIRNTLAGAEEE